MRTRILAAVLFGVVGVAANCAANPDGPVGSVVLTPKYMRDTGGIFQGDQGLNWRLGMELAIPVNRYLTLQGDVARVHYEMLGVQNVPSAIVGSRLKTDLGVSLRIYIPFTPEARQKLDDR